MSLLLICFLIGSSCRNFSSPVYFLSFLEGHDLRLPRSLSGRTRKVDEIIQRLGGLQHWSEATGTHLNVTVEGPVGGGRMELHGVGTSDR
jgi:hypothetical protein